MEGEKDNAGENKGSLYNRKLKRLVIDVGFNSIIFLFIKLQIGKNHPHSKQINDWRRSSLENSNFPKVQTNNLYSFSFQYFRT